MNKILFHAGIVFTILGLWTLIFFGSVELIKLAKHFEVSGFLIGLFSGYIDAAGAYFTYQISKLWSNNG